MMVHSVTPSISIWYSVYERKTFIRTNGFVPHKLPPPFQRFFSLDSQLLSQLTSPLHTCVCLEHSFDIYPWGDYGKGAVINPNITTTTTSPCLQGALSFQANPKRMQKKIALLNTFLLHNIGFQTQRILWDNWR